MGQPYEPRTSGWTRRLRCLTVAVLALVLSIGTTYTAAPSGAVTPVNIATEADRCYIGLVYQVLLGRPATSDEISSEATKINYLGWKPAQVPGSLAAAEEWLGATVRDIYRQALDREPDAAGLAYWVDQLRSGVRVRRIVALVYGSPEMLARSGGTLPGLVEQMFARLLGRNASAADRNYWADRAGTEGRGAVAAVLHSTAESRGRRVDALYRLVLGRSADAAGRTYWVGRLVKEDDVRLGVVLAASAEARSRAASSCWWTDSFISGGAVADHRLEALSADGRTALLSTLDSLSLVDMNTGAITPVPMQPGPIRGADLSGDGATVAYVGGETGSRRLFVHDLAAKTTEPVTEPGKVADPSLDHGGRVVAFASADDDLVDDGLADGQADIFVHHRDTDTFTRVVGHTAGMAFGPDLSADGSRVAFVSMSPPEPDPDQVDPSALRRRSEVFIGNTSSGTATMATQNSQAQPEQFGPPVFGLGGTRITFPVSPPSTHPGQPPRIGLRTYDLQTMTSSSALSTSVWAAGHPAASDEVDRIVAVSTYGDPTVGLFAAVAVRDTNDVHLLRTTAHGEFLALSGNENAKVSADGRTVVFTGRVHDTASNHLFVSTRLAP